MSTGDVVHEVARALAREPRVSLTHRPVRVGLDHGDVVLEGEVEDVAAKKLALERTATIPGVDRIIDRLHVATHQHVPDEQLVAQVCAALRQERALRAFRIFAGELAPGEEPALDPGERGFVAVRAEDGVVTLDGNVTGLGPKRLAGTLAWWVAGVRDVVNGLGVEPPQQDSEPEITHAVRLALEKDPQVRSSRIRVSTHGTQVQLSGEVSSEEEARQAEADAWCTFGVDRVENALHVSAVH